MNLRSASATVVLGILGIAVVAIAAWMLLIGPIMGDVSDTEDATQAAVDQNQMMTVQVHGLERQRDELPATKKVAGQLEEIFPATADQPGFFAAVNRAARSAGIPADKVTTLSPTAPVLLDASGVPAAEGTTATTPSDGSAVTAELAQQTVSVTVEGSYEQVRKLLGHLEEMPRAFLVSSLSITGGSAGETTGEAAGGAAGGGSSNLTVSITGSTFVAPPVTYPELVEGDSPDSTG